ncbi:MAG: hypothetical protein KatS3mg111_1042 [Pirellulaceae bacterium]|nr:MAG: hypothetical protein KatS3mg111_1042 [Pirellulaceae bacterium]
MLEPTQAGGAEPGASDAAASVPPTKPKRSRRPRSVRLLSVLQPFDSIVILTHDNPDPDAIASGWGLLEIIRQRLRKPVRLVGGGAIVRAENRFLVQVLKPPIELVNQLPLQGRTAIVLVDCSAQARNFVSCQDEQATLVAVIDHHQQLARGVKLPFQDIRPAVAASATIISGYLREQQMVPSRELATALLYALRSETRGYQTHFSRADRAALNWLTPHADPSTLAKIEDAPLPRSYYSDLTLALQNTFLYGPVAFCLLPHATGAEIVGEVADLLIRCEGVSRVLCGAQVGPNIAISVRTDAAGGDAAILVRKTLEGLGRGGGHRNRAGGIIPGREQQEYLLPPPDGPVDGTRQTPMSLRNILLKRWLHVCGADHYEPERLVPRHEIICNLK